MNITRRVWAFLVVAAAPFALLRGAGIQPRNDPRDGWLALFYSPQHDGFYREALADCVEESDRVLVMLNTLMDISEAESGAMQLQREPVTLADVVARNFA